MSRSKQNGTSWDDVNQPYVDLADLIRDMGDLVVLVGGFLGNCWLLLVLRRLPSSTYSVFFKTVALSDHLLLVAGPLARLFHAKLSINYFSAGSSWQCKLHTMTYRTVTILSTWMLVSLTMLRAASALWPLRVSDVWTKEKSRATVGIVIIIIIVINCFLITRYGIVREYCKMLRPRSHLVWIRQFQVCFLPFLLLILTNSVLLWTLVRPARTRKCRVLAQQGNQDFREQKVSSWTVTLIAVSVCFVLLTTPLAVSTMMDEYGYYVRDSPIHSGQHSVFISVCYVLFYCNSAIKFYLSCFTTSKFRAELRHTLKQLCGLCQGTTKSIS